jgi:lipopolysaccharide transport system ATP-binding protein
VVDVGQLVTLHVSGQANAFIEKLVLGYGIKDRLGQVIYGTNTELKNQLIYNIEANSLITFNIVFSANLGPGTYSIPPAFSSSGTHMVNNYEWRDLALIFNVINVNKPHFAGCNWIDPIIEIKQL